MEKEITFTACQDLDFDDCYDAKKVETTNSKVCWERGVEEDLPQLVQFCKKRGRLNSPNACLCEQNKKCSDYVEKEHKVTLIPKK